MSNPEKIEGARTAAPSPKMVISPLWLQFSLLTFIFGFTILGFLAVRIQKDHPPIPAQVQDANSKILFTGQDIIAGQQLFQRYGLMQLGTIFGHGAYLGPDFTAQYLHGEVQAMKDFYRGAGAPPVEADARVKAELKRNAYNPQKDILIYTPGQVFAFEQLNQFYRDFFGDPAKQTGPKRIHITDPDQTRQLTAFFSWAAWVSAAARPGADYSYTNNWPSEPAAGNYPTVQAFLWSVLSLIALLGGSGIILFAVGRYDLLGWHRADDIDTRLIKFRPPEQVRLTPLATSHGVVFPRSGRPIPSSGTPRRSQRALPRGAGRILRARSVEISPLQPQPHVAPATRHLFRRLQFSRHGNIHHPHDRRLRTAPPGEARNCAFRRSGAGGGRKFARRGGQHTRIHEARRSLVLARRPGMGISRPRQTLADTPHRRNDFLGNHPRAGIMAASPRRAPRQHALALSLQRHLHPGLLRRRNGLWKRSQFRRHGFLAILGGPPLGRGFPRTLHHHHGRLHVRSPRSRSHHHRHPRGLSRYRPLFRRRSRGNDAPPLFQRSPPPSTCRSGPSSRPWRSSPCFFSPSKPGVSCASAEAKAALSWAHPAAPSPTNGPSCSSLP